MLTARNFAISSPAAPATADGWLALRMPSRAGHSLSFFGLVMFTAILYFRPQDYAPGLKAIPFALLAAVFTLACFVPTQILLEGRLTARPRELNLLLLLSLAAVLSIPLAFSPGEALMAFGDQFLKVALMFVVMINVVRTESRWKILFWVSLAIAVFLAANSIDDYRTGQTPLEGYRVAGAAGGMFADPNDMALFFVTVMPITLALLLGTRNVAAKLFYAACLLTMLGGIIFTYSRGGFIGLVVMAAVLAYKLGRGRRLIVGGLGLVALVAFVVFAPGNYAARLASITNPGLDVHGTPAQRQQLLFMSAEVALKNPIFGVGMENFHHYSIRHKPSHNAYTQVAADMGLPALGIYLAFIIVPLLYLNRMERETANVPAYAGLHYLSIGLQASLVGYMASSFFLSVAYYWIVYYLVGCAVCLRRIYETEPGRILGPVSIAARREDSSAGQYSRAEYSA